MTSVQDNHPHTLADDLEAAEAALADATEAVARAVATIRPRVEAAPDAKPARWQRGNRTQITISLAPELLDQLDQVANRKHLNRSAMLTVLIGDALAREERAA